MSTWITSLATLLMAGLFLVLGILIYNQVVSLADTEASSAPEITNELTVRALAGDAMGAWNAVLSGTAIAFAGIALLLQSVELRKSNSTQRDIASGVSFDQLAHKAKAIEYFLDRTKDRDKVYNALYAQGLRDDELENGYKKILSYHAKMYGTHARVMHQLTIANGVGFQSANNPSEEEVSFVVKCMSYMAGIEALG